MKTYIIQFRPIRHDTTFYNLSSCGVFQVGYQLLPFFFTHHIQMYCNVMTLPAKQIDLSCKNWSWSCKNLSCVLLQHWFGTLRAGFCLSLCRSATCLWYCQWNCKCHPQSIFVLEQSPVFITHVRTDTRIFEIIPTLVLPRPVPLT